MFVDAGFGTVTDEVTEEHHRLSAAWAELQKNPLTYDGGGGALKDGTRVQLLANIGNAADAEKAAVANADGVGLFRTEFLFLDREDEPSVEEQTLHRDLRAPARQEGRGAHDRRRRGQAAALPHRC